MNPRIKSVGVTEERVGSGPVRVMGVNPLGLAVGVKLFEFGHDVEMVSCSWVPDEKAQRLLNATREVLLKIHGRNNAEVKALDSLEFGLSAELLDQELLRKAYWSSSWGDDLGAPNEEDLRDSSVGRPQTNLVYEDDMSLAMKPLLDESVAAMERTWQRVIPSDCVAVVFAYPDDVVNLMCCRLYMRYKEKSESEHSTTQCSVNSEDIEPQQKVVAIINDAKYAQALSAIGVIPVYTLSSITELVSRIALTATLVVMKPDDLVHMIHPLESKTTCRMSIEEHVSRSFTSHLRPYPRNYHSGRSLLGGRSLSMSENITEGISLSREGSFHPFNELSNLSALGLASPHVARPEVRIPMSFDILGSSLQAMSPRSSAAFSIGLRRSGTM